MFRAGRLPAPLAEWSPWLDWLGAPWDQISARLGSQQHRRIIKTHTPLDGLPLDPHVRYLVAARHPLDAAVSMYHQNANLTGRPTSVLRAHVRSWLLSWITTESDPRQQPDSLRGVLHHLRDAWLRRERDPVLLVHYDDLVSGLGAQMRAIATWLNIAVGSDIWPTLVNGAGLDSMRARADELVPGKDLLACNAAFFRHGRSGTAAGLLTVDELHDYYRMVAQDLPGDLMRWLHRPWQLDSDAARSR